MKGMESPSMTAVSSAVSSALSGRSVYVSGRDRQESRRQKLMLLFETVTHHANTPDALLKQLWAREEFSRCGKEICECLCECV